MQASAGPGGAYCRLTVLAPRSRVDLALPVDVPLGELVPMVLELIDEPARSAAGHRPVPWRLSGPAGGPLPAEATLAGLGVLDGELLRIGPAAPPPPAPVFDDPVDALAAAVGARARAPGGIVDRRLGSGAVLVLAGAAAGLIAGVRGTAAAGPLVVASAVVLGAASATAALLYTARRAGRVAPDGPGPGPQPDGDLAAALTAALAALPPAAAAGWAVLPGVPGAAHLLLAAAAAGTAAAVGQAALRVVAPALVGAVVLAVATGSAALLRLWFDVPLGALAAGLGAAALAVGPMLPRCALRLAGLPRPEVPTDAAELVAADTAGDLLPPGELAERADLARGLLAGTTGGCAVVAGAAAVLAAAQPGWAGAAFAVVTVAVLLLRARGFVDPVPARALLVSGLVAGIGTLVPAAGAAGPVGRVAGALALLLTAALLVHRGDRVGSPVARRAVDVLEVVLVALAIPLALGVMGLYELVRGL